MTETIQETRMREAMKPLGEILGKFYEIIQKPESEFVIFPIHISLFYWPLILFGIGNFMITVPITFILLLVVRNKRIKIYQEIESIYEKITATSYDDLHTLKHTTENIELLVSRICPSPIVGVLLSTGITLSIFKNSVSTFIQNFKNKTYLFSDIPPLSIVWFVITLALSYLIFYLGNQYYLKTRFEKPLAKLKIHLA
jgi:hypothetical protein